MGAELIQGFTPIVRTPEGVLVTVCARVARVTVLPDSNALAVRLVDGSGQAELSFDRHEAPCLPTGATVIVEGIARPGAGTRQFDVLALSVVDGEGRAHEIFPPRLEIR